MNLRYNLVALCLFILVLVLLLTRTNDSNLLVMTFDTQESGINMTLDGEKYYWIGSAPNNIKRNKKVAIVKPEKNLPISYVYTIKGYNENDFLIVEERTVGLVLSVYAHESIENIPWELLAGNVMIDMDEHINFYNEDYYYFSKTPPDFLVEKELSKINIDGNIVSIYKIPNRPESEWLAVKDETFNKDGYMLYWIRGTSLPREYADSWRIYGR